MEQEGGVDGAGPIGGYGPAPKNGVVGVLVAQVPPHENGLAPLGALTCAAHRTDYPQNRHGETDGRVVSDSAKKL